jgi:hypothetical protein
MAEIVHSPAAIRAEFERLIVDDLLGPFGGPNEIIPNQPVPRDRYLVGLLAPRQSYVSPSRFDSATAADASGSTSEDHVASPPQLVPSALGLTFAVPAGTLNVTVDVSWGQYRRESIETDAKSQRMWQRTPRGGTIEAVLPTSGAIAEYEPDSECKQVRITGRVRPLKSYVLVTLFLVNEQINPNRISTKPGCFKRR